jgi:hypothetical protein
MKNFNTIKIFLLAVSLLISTAANPALAQQTAVHLLGTDFTGGANQRFGSKQSGHDNVNYIYAQPTGPYATMRATFNLEQLPLPPLFLHIKAIDDNYPGQCDIEITLNGKVLFQGPNRFPRYAWQVQRFPIPPGALKVGTNELVVTNREKTGQLGIPPWFMLAWCAVAAEEYTPTVPGANITKDFFVTLPEQIRPMPEPLPKGQSEPGFKILGIKGWFWKPEQYLTEIPTLAKYKMNFLMNCYGSMYTNGKNQWWLPIPEPKKRGYEKVIRACQQHGIQFCFSFHPQLHSPRPLDPTSDEDFEKYWQHFAWAQGLGVKWFNIPLDDVTGVRIDGAEHASFVNKLFQRLRADDPQAQLIFCPTRYWGDGTANRPYLEPLARQLHKDIYIFWTGDSGVTQRITRSCAESYKSIINHRLIIWDNYPVNDNNPTMHLGPVTGRDPDLCEIADGYMSNPMCTQNQINRIPLLTCADYAYNPKAYDPARSIGQAIAHLANTNEQRIVLKDLVEAYPGMLLFGADPRLNPVRKQFNRLASTPHSRFIVEIYIRYLEKLSERLDRAFPGQFGPAKKTFTDDITWMKQEFDTKYKK